MAKDGINSNARRQLRRWWASIGLFAIALAIAFFGYRSYRAVERDLSNAALSGRTAISVLAATTLNQDFERLADVARALASRVRFGRLIEAGRWQEAAQIMANVPRDFVAVEQVLITDTNGTLQAAIMAADIDMEPPPPDQLSALPVVRHSFVSDVQIPVRADGSYFLVAVPVARQEGPLLAMLTLRVSTRRFQYLFAQLPMEPQGSIQVVDRSGRVAFDTEQPANPTILDLSGNAPVQRMLKGETGVELEGNSDGGDARDVAAFAPTSVGWGVLARWPQQTVFAVRDDQLHRVLMACGLFAALVIVAVGLVLQLAVERSQTDTERRANAELESRVRQRTGQLEKANVELESFSYSVSHDLRAPLRAIDGYVHFLFDEHQDLLGASAKRCIDNVHRNVRHMSRLIDELLELSRVGRVALKQECIDMAALVNDVLPVVLGSHTQVSVSIEQLPAAHADATLIRQIWVNLLDNAIKYSSRATTPQITVCGQAEAGHVTYCVADNGVGFDMEHYEQLFKPFSRLHSPGEFTGTGVGLALVKRIIERHDGRVWAESIPNQSTKVFFSLPNVLESVVPV
jgi:signal transduction histidine kinase